MIQSLPYKPDPAKCCEACVFGTGEHEPWCSGAAPKPKPMKCEWWKWQPVVVIDLVPHSIHDRLKSEGHLS